MDSDHQGLLDHLAQHGIITSIVYGQCGDKGIMFSVNVLTPIGRSFDRPFSAASINHAIRIAYKECTDRGWCEPLGE